MGLCGSGAWAQSSQKGAGSESTGAVFTSLRQVVEDPDEMADLAESRFAAAAESLLVDLIRIPTVAGNHAARKAFGDRLAQEAKSLGLGFEEAVDGHIFRITLGPPGEGRPREKFWVLAHGDVVPADPALWPVDPFAGIVREDTIYGRGALDDKGGLVPALFAMAAIREAKTVPRREPVLVIGMDEETDWFGIRGLLAETESPPRFAVVVDADYPMTIGERGYVDLAIEATGAEDAVSAPGPRLRRISGGSASNVVPAKAEFWVEVSSDETPALIERLKNFAARIEIEMPGSNFEVEAAVEGVRVATRGVAAHGSRPELGQNAIVPLVRLAVESRLATGPWGETLRILSERVGADVDGSGLGIASSLPCLGATSVNLGWMETEGETLRAVLNIRPTTEQTVAEIEKALSAQFQGPGLSVRVYGEPGMNAFLGNSRSPLASALLDAYGEETGRIEEAGCIGGTTYAKAFLGTKTMAVSFGPAEPALGEDALYHADPEYLLRSALIRNLRIYASGLFQVARYSY